MKTKEKKTQPDFNIIEVTCATCDKKYKIGTTVTKIKIETCSGCHSFYTGNQFFATVAGQVDKFNKRYNNSSQNKKNN